MKTTSQKPPAGPELGAASGSLSGVRTVTITEKAQHVWKAEMDALAAVARDLAAALRKSQPIEGNCCCVEKYTCLRCRAIAKRDTALISFEQLMGSRRKENSD